jgi:hypothetical protein
LIWRFLDHVLWVLEIGALMAIYEVDLLPVLFLAVISSET